MMAFVMFFITILAVVSVLMLLIIMFDGVAKFWK